MSLIVPVVPHLNLQPGELFLSVDPSILRTILGSCVGIAFWSKRIRAGALCHGVLPRCPQVWLLGAQSAERYRYVDYCIRYLAQQFDALGVRRNELEVKLFGGADVLSAAGTRTRGLTVGAQNCIAAEETLEEEGLRVCASDLGGTCGRRIHFHTGTGVVLVQQLDSPNGQKP